MLKKYRCKNEILAELRDTYNKVVALEYGSSFLKALKNFDFIK